MVPVQRGFQVQIARDLLEGTEISFVKLMCCQIVATLNFVRFGVFWFSIGWQQRGHQQSIAIAADFQRMVPFKKSESNQECRDVKVSYVGGTDYCRTLANDRLPGV
ncbi:hypothetical protein RA27_20305 [Ruegeria sp. ANG-R]|nr:hypothetical protein RA27_20305 [Ruegeria sp. ANG-R]